MEWNSKASPSLTGESSSCFKLFCKMHNFNQPWSPPFRSKRNSSTRPYFQPWLWNLFLLNFTSKPLPPEKEQPVWAAAFCSRCSWVTQVSSPSSLPCLLWDRCVRGQLCTLGSSSTQAMLTVVLPVALAGIFCNPLPPEAVPEVAKSVLPASLSPSCYYCEKWEWLLCSSLLCSTWQGKALG